MKILITGTSQGIGKAIAERFLKENHTVIGIDRQEKSITNENYIHYICDVRDFENLPQRPKRKGLLSELFFPK